MRRIATYLALLVGFLPMQVLAQAAPGGKQEAGSGLFLAVIDHVMTEIYKPGAFDQTQVYLRLLPEPYVLRVDEDRPRTRVEAPPFRREIFEVVARRTGRSLQICPPEGRVCCTNDESWMSIGFSQPDVKDNRARVGVDIMYRLPERSRSEGRSLDLLLLYSDGSWKVERSDVVSYSTGVACPPGEG